MTVFRCCHLELTLSTSNVFKHGYKNGNNDIVNVSDDKIFWAKTNLQVIHAYY